MNIAIFTHYSELYGANRSLINLTAGLKNLGYNIIVISPIKGRINEILEENGIKTYSVPFPMVFIEGAFDKENFGKRIKDTANAMDPIVNICINNRIDLVYSNSSVIDLGLIISKRINKPHIWHFREFGDLDYQLFPDYGKKLYDSLLKLSDGIIYVSDALKNHFGYINNNCNVIYNGIIHMEELKSNISVWVEKRLKPILKFVIVGLVRPSKGQDKAVYAFKHVLKHYPEATLTIVGGDQVQWIEQIVKENNLEKNVEIVGEAANPFEYYLKADAALMCSPMEAMGRVTVEAMACGLPVIGFNSAGTTELINNGYNGLLYDGSVEDLFNRIMSLIKQPLESRKMGLNAINDVMKNYTVEVHAKNVSEFINKTILEYSNESCNNQILNPDLNQFENEIAKIYNQFFFVAKYNDSEIITSNTALLSGNKNNHEKNSINEEENADALLHALKVTSTSRSLNYPKISIITPSFNQGEFLEDTIKSVLDQNYPNLEYIIIDGGSTDNSVEIIKKYEKHINYWVSEKDNGQTDAINRGFKKASGDVIAWLNSDDYYFPGALNLVSEMYLSEPEAGLYIGNGAVADREGKRIRRYSNDIIFDYDTLLKGSNYILQPSTFINAKAVKEVGSLDESFYYAMDLEYWLRVASKFSVITVNEELSAYRWYDDIKTKTGGLKRWVEQWGIIHQYSKLQITPGLLVEFFNVLQEKEVNDHLGINVSEFSQKIRLQFYQVMQQLLNTNDCIPKQGNGKIFSPAVKSKNDQSPNEKKTINIVRSLGFKPKIDIVMPEGHSWFVREGYAEALKHYGVFNQSFYVNQNDSNRELFEYLKNPTSDFILLMNTDWHAQYLHNNFDWQKRWEANNSTKILFSFECMNNPTIKKDNRWWNDNITAVDNALRSVDAVVFAHEIDEELFSKYGKPVLWQPFAIDEQLFPQPKRYSERTPKGFFKGKTTPFYYEETYSQRRKLIDTLKSSNKTEIFDTYEEEKGTTRERALNFISTMNNYQIVLGLPSLSPTMVVRPFEAMASGAVFFQNKILGSRSNKLFTDGVDIINYDEDKPEELFSSLNNILNNPESSEKIAEAGYQKVMNNHTIKDRINEMLGWIENNFTETQNTVESNSIKSNSAKTPKIVVDGIIFQLQKNQPLGISRVWTSLLTELGKKENNILLLDRGNTAPNIAGIEKFSVSPFYGYELMPAEVCHLDDICSENCADLFISTYYTYTENTPSLLMLHDFIPEIYKWKGMEWTAKSDAIKKAFAYLSVSKSTANDLRKFYPASSSKKVEIIYNAVSDEFSPKSEKQLLQFKKKYNIERPYFVISGSRTLYKNVVQFAAAFAQLKSKDKYEILFTGGNPELEPDLKKLLGETKYQIVYLSVEELSTAYSGALALVYPSKYEGFGLPVIEAMKSGCPVITCKNSSLKEVAGGAALYVKEDDIQSMKNALINVEKPSVRQKFVDAGLENARRFTWSSSSDKLYEVMNAIAQTQKPVLPSSVSKLNSTNKFFYEIKKNKQSRNAFDELILQFSNGLKADENLILESEKILGLVDLKTLNLFYDDGELKEINCPYCHYLLALNYLYKSNYAKALELFYLTFANGLAHWIIASHMADILIRLDRTNEAMQMLEKIIVVHPEHQKTLKRISDIKSGNTINLNSIKVSAIVSTYNSENFITGCLDDLIEQSLYKSGELEIVVIDSGSEENEGTIIKEYQKKYSNIFYERTEKETIYSAWNRGIKLARGKYITNANTDDRHAGNALEKLAEILDGDESIGVTYSDMYKTIVPNDTFSSNNKKAVVKWMDFDSDLLLFGCFVGPQPMWRKSLHEKYGMFDDALEIVGDYEFWLRLSRNVEFYHLKEILGLYYYSEKSAEHRNENITKSEDDNIREYYLIKNISTNEDAFRILSKLELIGAVSELKDYYERAKGFVMLRQNGLQIEEQLKSVITNSNSYNAEELISTLEQLIAVLTTSNVLLDKEKYLIILYNLCGMFYLKENVVDRAKSSFENALSLNPESSEACAGLGEVFILEDDFDAAKTMFEWSSKFEPENKQAANRLKELNNIQTQQADSHIVSIAGNELIKKLEDFLSAVDSLITAGEYEKSLNLLNQSQQHFAELNSDEEARVLQSTFAVLYGFAQLGLNKVEEAKECFEESIELNSDSSEACRGLGEVFIKNNMYEEAAEMFESAVKNYSSNIKAISRLNELYGATATNAVGEDLITEKEQMFERAYNFFAQKKYVETKSLLDEMEIKLNAELNHPETNMFSSAFYNLKGFNYLALNLLDDARTSFENALEYNPDSSKACYGLGEVFYLSKDDSAAKVMFEWAVKNDPSDMLSISGLSKINKVLNLNELHNSLNE